ncbi:hypothetical protein AXG93_2334s1210 [Marchantia polymorpha subsp. ruderalis]|uniref:Retrotransposon Copia-like N-terminal domain-containing protein n=1 Tax=Marchantia polymorpha subsp. ruderalis TaxID=1480154 RepID=A0A176W4D8_MARPO|nr:hypothetical protein AXG93_2334s1210 [Marchantia polymorpha subsp. ruderalis]
MHPKDEIAVTTDGTSSFRRIEMASKQVAGIGYNILPLDGRSDYLLWEKQVKGKLRSMGLANVLKDKLMHVTDIDWKDSQEQAVYIVMYYLDPSVMKQVEEYPEVTQLFDALQRRFHKKEISHVMNNYMRLLNFRNEAGLENSGLHSRLRRFVGRSSKRGGTGDVVILSPIHFKYYTYYDPGSVATIRSGQSATYRVQAAEIEIPSA